MSAFGGKSDMAKVMAGCLLLTQSGHRGTEIPQCSGLLAVPGVLSFRSEVWEAPAASGSIQK